MSAGDGIRWEVRNNPQPRGMLQSAYPLREPHKPTELNLAGIYAPPGDPLHRPDLAPPAESPRAPRVVIGTCIWLGCWGLFGFALCYFLGAL